MRRRRPHAPAGRRRGAVLLETALVAPLLTMFLAGIIEFGTAWRDNNGIANAVRASGRTAASQGSSGTADYYALQALKAGLSAIKGATIERVVIFNATSNNLPDPNCLAMAVPGGQSGSRACNVYGVTELSLPASSFSTTGSACPGSAVDRFYCPTSRSVLLGSGTDYVGVYVKLSRPTFTKLIGSTLTLSDTFVVRLEPS